jgi:hypothetical protein
MVKCKGPAMRFRDQTRGPIHVPRYAVHGRGHEACFHHGVAMVACHCLAAAFRGCNWGVVLARFLDPCNVIVRRRNKPPLASPVLADAEGLRVLPTFGSINARSCGFAQGRKSKAPALSSYRSRQLDGCQPSGDYQKVMSNTAAPLPARL